MIVEHPTEPCSDCPYRLNSPKEKWHRIEFEKVLAAEDDTIGKVFQCHKHRRRLSVNRGLCAGYAIDQKRRRVPSLALRMILMRHPEILSAFEKLDVNTPGLFDSVEEMCAHNGVTR